MERRPATIGNHEVLVGLRRGKHLLLQAESKRNRTKGLFHAWVCADNQIGLKAGRAARHVKCYTIYTADKTRKDK
jgi:hypothetical protein